MTYKKAVIWYRGKLFLTVYDCDMSIDSRGVCSVSNTEVEHLFRLGDYFVSLYKT